MSPEEKKIVANALEEKKALLTNFESSPHDYPSLKLRIINQELQDELENLNDLLNNNPEGFKEAFKIRCKERAKRNHGTCISFFALPQGDCNTLYWQIAESLFTPRTLGDMLSIILPDNVVLITPELNPGLSANASSEGKRAALKNPAIQLTKKSLSTLSEAPNIERLTQFVAAEDCLFDVNDMATFKFSHHQNLFKRLQDEKPALMEKLYQHNNALGTLHNQILTVNNNGQTPYEAIKILIQELLLGGERFTQKTYATLKAQVAYTDFVAYFYTLPENLKSRLMLLRTEEDITLSDILNDLNNEDCVETAANRLQRILDNAANQHTLHTRPHFAEEQINAIQKQYGKMAALPLTGHDPSIVFPVDYLTSHLERIEINDAFDYLSLLLAFPTEYYDSLLKYVQINCQPTLPEEFIGMINTGVLNSEQLSAFNEAIKNNYPKLGIMAVLDYALDNRNYDLLTFILSQLTEQQFLDINKSTVENSSLIHRSRYDLEAFKIILSFWSTPEKLLNAIHHCNLLNQVAHDPVTLKMILDLVPPHNRVEAIKARDATGKNVLHAAIRYPHQLETILNCIPENERRFVILQRDIDGNTPIDLVWNKGLEFLLKSLPEKDRLAVITSKNKEGQTLLHQHRYSELNLTLILGLLPEKEVVNAVTAPNEQGYNLIYLTSASKLPALLELLPEEDRVTALNNQHAKYKPLLGLTVYEWSILEKVLLLLPEENRFSVLCDKDEYGFSVLHKFAESSVLGDILNLLPQKDREAALNLGRRSARVIDWATSEGDVESILSVLPEESHLRVLLSKNTDGGYPFKKIRSNPSWLEPLHAVLSEADWLKAISYIDERGGNALHQIVDFQRNLQNKLASLPYSENLKRYHTLQNIEAALDATNKILETLPKKTCVNLLTAQTKSRNNVLHRAANHPELLKTLLNLLPQETRMDIVQTKNLEGFSVADLAAKNVATLQVILVSLPEVPHLKIKRGVTQTGHLVALHRQIKLLKNHGNKMQVSSQKGCLDEHEGQKAVALAETLEDLAVQFINADKGSAQRQNIRNDFQLALAQGHREMQRHRAKWKPVLANIAIAATGIGLLVLIGKCLTTGNAFFASTHRQNIIDAVKQNFEELAYRNIPN